jgi:uncharacterized protein (TIGR03067 family)
MRTHLLCSAVLFAATTVAIADEPALTGDLARLQGQWTALFGPQKSIPIVVTIQGKSATLAITRPDGREYQSKGEIKIDEDAQPYKTIDWIKFTTSGGEPAPVNLGIYMLKGDSITICNGGPGNERPTEFKAGEGGPPQLLVLNRKATTATTPTGDLARLQGRWTAKVGPRKDVSVVLIIENHSATFTFSRADGRQREAKGEFTIDETAKPHKTLTWSGFTTPDGKATAENLAIYQIEGNTLTICSGGIGNARPTEFKAGEGGPPQLLVLNRE